MDPKSFEDALLRDGYEPALREYPPGPTNTEHTHPFAVRGLILEGEFIITTAEGSRSYRAGDVFDLPAGVPHTEGFGPEGSKNLIGRLHPPG